jgi:hypothetical protein
VKHFRSMNDRSDAKGTSMSTDLQEKARRLRNAVEPDAAGVFSAPEAHAYTALGCCGLRVPRSPRSARRDGIPERHRPQPAGPAA